MTSTEIAGRSGLDWLRAAQDRDFGNEGIPMVLGLFRVTGVTPQVSDPEVLADAARIVTTLDALREQLFPTQRDSDLGCLISTLQATSAVVAGEPS